MDDEPAVQPVLVFGLQVHETAIFAATLEFFHGGQPLGGDVQLEHAEAVGGGLFLAEAMTVAASPGEVGKTFLVEEFAQQFGGGTIDGFRPMTGDGGSGLKGAPRASAVAKRRSRKRGICSKTTSRGSRSFIRRGMNCGSAMPRNPLAMTKV